MENFSPERTEYLKWISRKMSSLQQLAMTEASNLSSTEANNDVGGFPPGSCRRMRWDLEGVTCRHWDILRAGLVPLRRTD